MKTIQDLIMSAAGKCAAELSRRREQNSVELSQLNGANEGIDFFIKTLVEEIRHLGKDTEQGPESEGQNTPDEQRVESEESH